jgi:predicted transposase/invertase (TIGR01784 family)
MNPIQELQLLHEFIHRKETSETVGNIASADYFVSLRDAGLQGSRYSKNAKATQFLRDMVANFEDMRKAFPKAHYNGTMDFVCELEDGKYALVEMQVLPKDNWDKRALAYVAAFYGNQLRKGLQWSDVKEVVGINILGGGTREQGFWKDTDGQYMRHYKFEEQCHKQSCERFIDGIQLFQYSLMNAPTEFDSSERAKQDWITFFKRGSRMTEEEVKSEILTKAVLKAFKRATLLKLPKSVKKNYDAENLLYAQCSEHTAELVAEGRAEGEARGRADAILQVAGRLIQSTKLTDAAIAKSLELEESQVAKMRVGRK